MKLVKYFLQKRAVTILLLVLVLAGGLFSYFKIIVYVCVTLN